MNELDKQLAAEIMEDCFSGDTETNHCIADAILCRLLTELGYVETVKAWEAVDKWFA